VSVLKSKQRHRKSLETPKVRSQISSFSYSGQQSELYYLWLKQCIYAITNGGTISPVALKGMLMTLHLVTASLSQSLVTPHDEYGFLVPLEKRMSRPQSIQLFDANGDEHDCIGEGFKTGYQVFLLIHRVSERKALFVGFN
jgi:hypothetical protein